MRRRIRVFLMLILSLNGTLYADEMRMPENTPRPLKIGVAVFVNNITKVNDQAGTFEGNLDLQLRWKNVDLAFNAKEMGTNRLEFENDSAVQKIASIWTPALTLANATIQSMEQGLFIYADGTVVHIQRVKGVFDANYRLDAFPFDTQNLPVRIVSERYNTNQIALIQEQRDLDNSGLRKDMSLLSWQPKRLKFVASRTRGWNGQFLSGNASPNCACQGTNRLSPGDAYALLSRFAYSHHRYILHKNGYGQTAGLHLVFHPGPGCPEFYLLVTLRHVASGQHYNAAYCDWIGVSNRHDSTVSDNFQSAQRQSLVCKQVYYS